MRFIFPEHRHVRRSGKMVSVFFSYDSRFPPRPRSPPQKLFCKIADAFADAFQIRVHPLRSVFPLNGDLSAEGLAEAHPLGPIG